MLSRVKIGKLQQKVQVGYNSTYNEFNKLTIRPYSSHTSVILAPNYTAYMAGQINYVSDICVRPNPVAMVTKIWKF